MHKDPRQVSGQKNIPYTRYCFFKSASILLQWRKITFFLLRRRRTKSRKTSEKNAGDSGRDWHKYFE